MLGGRGERRDLTGLVRSGGGKREVERMELERILDGLEVGEGGGLGDVLGEMLLKRDGTKEFS